MRFKKSKEAEDDMSVDSNENPIKFFGEKSNDDNDEDW